MQSLTDPSQIAERISIAEETAQFLRNALVQGTLNQEGSYGEALGRYSRVCVCC